MRLAPSSPTKVLLVIIVAPVVLPSMAHAYLDPGTGSYALQILVGVVLGGLFTLGVFWRRVLGFVKGLFHRKSDDRAGRV